MKATILAFLAFVAVVAGQDLCNDLVLGQAGQNVATNARPSDLLKCYQQIPIDKTRATTLIGILKDLALAYSFTEYACANLPPFNTNVCINDEIARIENLVNTDQYTSDYDFHADVAVTFNRLNDAHTRYVPPFGFSVCRINRQYALELSQQSSTAFFTGLFGANQNFDGAQVLTIDTLTPLQYFQKKANTFGVFRDPNVRFNAAVGGFFSESVDAFHLKDVADTESVVISQGGQTQTLTFTTNVTCIGDRTSTAKIILLNVGNKRGADFPSMQFSHPEIHKDPLKQMRELQKMLRTNTNQFVEVKEVDPSFQIPKMTERVLETRAAAIAAPLTGDGSLLEVVRLASDGTFVEFRYKGFPIWKVQSFLPSDPEEFLNIALNSIEDARARGDKNLIIDVSANGGGSVCLNMILASLLIRGWGGLPALGTTVPWNFVDVKKNVLMDSWVNDSPQIVANFLDPVNGNEFSEANWYNSQTVNKNIGGNSTAFTKKGYWPSPCGSGLPVTDYFFDSIYLITDGTCGSACSQFESHLQIQSGVFVMTYGGFPNGIPDTSSFAGGNVLDWQTVLVPATASSARAATPLPTTATLSFNHHIVYQNANDANPREFIRLEPDLHSFLYSPLLLPTAADQDAALQELSNIYETAAVGFGLIQPASAAFFVPSVFCVILSILSLLF